MARTKQGMKDARRKRQREDENDNHEEQPQLVLLDPQPNQQPSNPPKRQRRGKSKNITRRKQNSDEKLSKRTSRDERQEDIQDQQTIRRPCPTCLQHGNTEASTTHSRSSSRLCPYHKLPQSAISRQLLGGNTRTVTIKHGIEGILKILRNNEKTQFLSGLAKVVDFNRRVMICGHLFILYYFTQRLSNGLQIPLVFFDYRFVNGVYQLIIGRKWSNESLFEEETRAHIKASFEEFKRQVPNTHCPLVPSTVQGKAAIGFAKILTSTARLYASTMINHIVEGFEQIYISYLQARLARMVPALTRSQVVNLADFVYDTTSNNDDFPPTWPTIEIDPSLDTSAFDIAVNEALLELVNETSNRWNRLSVLMANSRQTSAPEVTEDDNDNDDTMSLDAQSSTSGSVATTNASTSTMGVSDLRIGDPSSTTRPISIKTSTLTRFPHLFISIMYDVLVDMEAMNATDAQLSQVSDQVVNNNWVYHHLSSLPEWKYLKHHQRRKLVYGLKKTINERTVFEQHRLPSVLGMESRQSLATIVTTTQEEIENGTFVSPHYLAMPKLRLFSILPVPAMTRKFIHVSHESLAEIMRHFGLGKYVQSHTSATANQLNPNFKIFNMSKIKSGTGIFENQFYTDGYSVCFPFKKPVFVSHGKPLTLSDMDPSVLGDFEVWGIDPGVSEIFVASNSSDPRTYVNDSEIPNEPILATPEQNRHQIRKMSAAEFYCLAGYPKTNDKIKQWKQMRDIDAVESGIGSPKTASFQQVVQYIQDKMSTLDLLLSFYGQDFQELRFLNYHGRQKATREMIKVFVDGGHKYGQHRDCGNTFDVQQRRLKHDGTMKQRRRRFEPVQEPPPPNTAKTNKWKKLPFEQSYKIPLLCIGDGKFDRRTFRGKPHGLAKAFRKAVKQAQRQHLLLAVDVNEAWTSKVCSICGARTIVDIYLDEEDRTSKLHKVVGCTTCHKLWQRDVNASRNIRSLALFAILGFVPSVFTNKYSEEEYTSYPPGRKPSQDYPSPHPSNRNLLDE